MTSCVSMLPNSPNFNSFYYKTQGVCQLQVHGIDKLKQHLLHVWYGMDHSIIDNAPVALVF